MLNKVALRLLKYVTERCPYKDSDYHQRRSRQLWDKYGELPISRAMKHSACTSLAELERLAKAFYGTMNP